MTRRETRQSQCPPARKNCFVPERTKFLNRELQGSRTSRKRIEKDIGRVRVRILIRVYEERVSPTETVKLYRWGRGYGEEDYGTNRK